jgi:hypothetical protein
MDALSSCEAVERHPFAVIPAKAGIPQLLRQLDSRLRLKIAGAGFAGMTEMEEFPILRRSLEGQTPM